MLAGTLVLLEVVITFSLVQSGVSPWTTVMYSHEVALLVASQVKLAPMLLISLTVRFLAGSQPASVVKVVERTSLLPKRYSAYTLKVYSVLDIRSVRSTEAAVVVNHSDMLPPVGPYW